MDRRPIRLVVEDDLERSRLTVFFRLLLAIPHFVWLILWSIGAIVVAVLNWFATLFLGRAPNWAHDFLSAYVRYSTHLYAYLYLAANPYPGFLGSPGSYPVDVEIDPPEPQRRLRTFFRLPLAIPAIVLSGTLAGSGGCGGGGGSGGQRGGDNGEFFLNSISGFGAVALAVALLAWFACLVRGRMPGGFRDLVAWTLRYGAETQGFVFLLTDRYPHASPFLPGGVLPERPLAARLRLADDLRRSRVTVFFRLLLAIPHLVWAWLWSYAALFAGVAQWFFTLVAGRPAEPLHRFLSAWVRYGTQVYAYVLLAANPFPGFVGAPGYPVEVELDAPGRQPRAVTFFRLFLALPAFLVAYALVLSALVAALFGWFAALVLGRMPVGLRNLVAYVLHYWAQLYAYVYLLTSRYPYSGPPASDPDREPTAEPEAAPA